MAHLGGVVVGNAHIRLVLLRTYMLRCVGVGVYVYVCVRGCTNTCVLVCTWGCVHVDVGVTLGG